ncbi:MAG: NusG domain II-containing protein [Candidatus Onthomonas sp.]|nr:NusG domain II-containing protein [Candidatus Onthomonas sp.]
MKGRKGRKDLLLWLALAAVGGGMVLLFRLTRPPAATVVVKVGGMLRASYSLMEDRVVTITGVGGGTNELHIEAGTVYLTEATCPDHLCVRQGVIRRAGESIVCLPNQVVVELRSEQEAELDGVTG